MTPMDEIMIMKVIQHIDVSLKRIADFMEAAEERAQARPVVGPDDMGALALWRDDVARGETILGFTEWMTWRMSDQEEEGAIRRGATEQ